MFPVTKQYPLSIQTLQWGRGYKQTKTTINNTYNQKKQKFPASSLKKKRPLSLKIPHSILVWTHALSSTNSLGTP